MSGKRIATVLVVLKASKDEVRINEAEFDARLHDLIDKADAPRVKAATTAAAATAAAKETQHQRLQKLELETRAQTAATVAANAKAGKQAAK